MPVALLLDCDEPACPDWSDVSDLPCASTLGNVDLAFAVRAASDFYRRMSGDRYCQRTDTVRPAACGPSCGCVPRGVYYRGDWLAWPTFSCLCAGGSEIDLAEAANNGVVTAIGDVTVDGEVLASSAYRLFNGHRLVRQDGGTWTCCQSLLVPAGEVGTWTVEFTHGEAVPPMGKAAAIELACEVAKALAGDASCSLPRRVQQVSRQQVSVSFGNALSAYRDGMVGLPLGDLFLSSLDDHAKARRGGTARRPGGAGTVQVT